MAVKLDGVKCSNSDDYSNGLKIINNYLINGGSHGKNSQNKDVENCYYCQTEDGADTLLSRCKMNQADSAFMFLTVIVLLVSLTLTYLRMRKGY